MTPESERARTLLAIRESLRDLVADGVDFLPRAPARARRAPEARPAPAPHASAPASSGFRPRVAPLAAPTQIGDAAAG